MPIVDDYLERMHAQREAIYAELAGVPHERLWHRPRPGKWSPGEHLDHTRVLNRSASRLLRIAWPVLRPFAALARKRPYETSIDDVYQRPSMPTRVGILWPPRYRPDRQASLARLRELATEEHLRIERFYRGRDERLLGHAVVWDPPIGRFNLIQGLRIVLYHDAHHFRAVREQLFGA